MVRLAWVYPNETAGRGDIEAASAPTLTAGIPTADGITNADFRQGEAGKELASWGAATAFRRPPALTPGAIRLDPTADEMGRFAS